MRKDTHDDMTPRSIDNRAITEYAEHEFVEWIYSDAGPIDHVGVPPLMSGPASVRLRVEPEPLGMRRGQFGDVDSLVIPRGTPSLARAIEFKIVKVRDAVFDGAPPNKMNDLARGVNQSNALAEAGFAWIWLSVVVQTDTSRRLTPSTQYMSAPPSVLDAVADRIPLDRLHKDVGVYMNEVAGPSLEYRSCGGRIIRIARQRDQNQVMTRAIEAYFKRTPAPVRWLE